MKPPNMCLNERQENCAASRHSSTSFHHRGHRAPLLSSPLQYLSFMPGAQTTFTNLKNPNSQTYYLLPHFHTLLPARRFDRFQVYCLELETPLQSLVARFELHAMARLNYPGCGQWESRMQILGCHFGCGWCCRQGLRYRPGCCCPVVVGPQVVVEGRLRGRWAPPRHTVSNRRCWKDFVTSLQWQRCCFEWMICC